ncbi:MAG: N-6 DNA methylase [Saprospiraceae bacterium]|nr:N-6 DNA methylase [Saprospiraceae bacterium]
MTTAQYIDVINNRYKLGNATEYTFRGELTNLIESLVPDIKATNEPKRQKCGAPDYILSRSEIEVGYIEAKDIGDIDLEGKKKNKEQFDRYKNGLPNIIFTDYVSFYFYREGQLITHISIGNITVKGILPTTENFNQFENLIRDFCIQVTQTIKSSKRLAELMAGKAKLLADVIGKALVSDVDSDANSTLRDQMAAFREILIHDITPKGFADVYAQTIAYGMFAARLHDPTIPTFSREEAATLIPRSNPFLRKLFGYIAGPDIDDRIRWIVDGLVDIFLACNVSDLLRDYGKSTKMEDPIIHFYETFLSMYDPALRKARGVWYTPHPVVSFQIRAIDDILKSEFGISQGIADNSKIKIKVNVQGKSTEREVHRVQMLDPATGTGTYLAEVIKHIYKKFEGQEGIWSHYVENDLLPRLIGFELLMASYAMAHLQLDLLLTETGYTPTRDQRLKVYLTNSLEESHPDTGTLFANWLSTEANEANHIKRDAPVMIVMGNPPYSVSSNNKGEWIEKLTADYKKDLNERNIQPLSDDYIKFIRYGQHFIEKKGSGILAYISNNSFIDGIIHRQMRKNLLESFDKVYILDLHGNAKKKEVCPDGSPDHNVFDIMQGVSINIFVKTGQKKSNELGNVFQFDLQGRREYKYGFLNKSCIKSIEWNLLAIQDSNYKFSQTNHILMSKYEIGFSLKDIFKSNNVGFTAARDSSLILFEKNKVESLLNDFEYLEIEELRTKHRFGPDSRDWTIKGAVEDLKGKKDRNITKINYRPFDFRFSHYSKKTKGFFSYPRWEIMQHFSGDKNIGLIATRLNRQQSLGYFWLSTMIIDRHILDSAGDSTSFFPLYLYPEATGQQTIDSSTERTPNLNPDIVQQIAEKLGIPFVAEKQNGNLCFSENNAELRDEFKTAFSPIDLLDYIYAVLHSPTYREKYKEFLKIDFPRVPYPKDPATFWKLVALGGQIRQIHLLESPIVETFITRYPVGGTNIVDKPVYKGGHVFINDVQHFAHVPEVAWNFYIGGYQPAQKWLKDRKGRTLSMDDIFHYQKIIVALTETDRLMKEVDQIEIE